jgi:cytochrome c oxidase assembly protein subunit 15
VQGAFGAWTVTWRLYPAIVTAHLLGALVLLALLTVQVQRARPDPVRLGPGLRAAVWALAALSAAQLALGGWVSTHYAVLACSDFPLCQGRWWPPMDFVHGFALRRGLGADADGNYLSFAALTAIHYAHRLGAYVVLTGMVGLAWRLWRDPHAALHRWAWGVAGIAAWQLATGVGNVVLGWPLAAAVAHTAGAAAWVVWLTALITRAHRPQRTSAVVRAQAASRVPAAS